MKPEYMAGTHWVEDEQPRSAALFVVTPALPDVAARVWPAQMSTDSGRCLNVVLVVRGRAKRVVEVEVRDISLGDGDGGTGRDGAA